MTERFRFICDDENCCFKDNDKRIDCYEVVELLNNYDREVKLLKLELDTHKNPLWSTREAERIVNEKEQRIIELTDLLAEEVKKNSILLEEINNLHKDLMICNE